MPFWLMKWVLEKQFRLFLYWLIWLSKREFGVPISSLYQQQFSWTGKLSSKDGALLSRLWHILVHPKKEKPKEKDGQNLILSMCVSQVIKLLLQTILFLEEKNGIIWFSMKLKILKTLDHKDGKSYWTSKLNIDFFSQELLFKTI